MNDHDAAAKISADFQAAWNAHDMTAFAALFHPDATFVNRLGSYWRGREDVVAQHARIHETIYRDTDISNRVQNVDMIADGVAVVHVRTNATFGPSMPRGPRELSGQFMYVATRRDGQWRIQAASNTALIDPMTGAPVIDR